MKRFFLYHSEKLILGLAVALTGLFFWMGFSAPVFDSKTPNELSGIAKRAGDHIQNQRSWEDGIEAFRKSANPLVAVKDSVPVDPRAYMTPAISGTPLAKLAPRLDPTIGAVLEPNALVFKAPLLITARSNARDPISQFSPAGSGGPALGGGAGLGLGDPGFGSGFNIPGAGEEEEDDRSSKKDDEDVRPELEGTGFQVQQVNRFTLGGINPLALGISNQRTRPVLSDVVVLTALVDMKQLRAEYEKSFANGVGYFPDRDKPIFSYLDVERRKIDDSGKPTLGPEGQWAVPPTIKRNIARRYPRMHRIPGSEGGLGGGALLGGGSPADSAPLTTAPEVISPENYDPVITQAIPPITLVDYAGFVNHPKLADKQRIFPQSKEDTSDDSTDAGDIGSILGDDDDEYDPSGGLGGLGGLGGQGGSFALGSGGGPGRDKEQTRAGSDMTDFAKELMSKSPAGDYKLVRFFDIVTEPGASYEYRVRVWLKDPNNEATRGGSGSGLGTGGGLGAGLGAGLGGGLGGFGTGQNQSGDDEDSEDDGSATKHTKIPITPTMTAPKVRERLGKQRSEKKARRNRDSNTRQPNGGTRKRESLTDYYVSEFRGTDEDGNEIVEEIKVPEDQPELRFSRPSPWSESVKITIPQKTSLVASGQVTPPKVSRIRVGDAPVELPLGEPTAEVVASVWSRELGTATPARRTVFRGAALDFYSPSHILHPATWQVYLAESGNDDAVEGGKYLLEIETGKVVVDIMGGEELPLPRSEKMRHHHPGEILVIDESGNMVVRNELEDRTDFRNSLFLPDESQVVGEPRKKKAKKSDSDDLFGPGGGFGGELGDDF